MSIEHSVAEREPIDDLADEFLARFRRGERPALTEYVTAHPHLADEIRELFPTLVMLERLGPRPEDLADQVAGDSPAAGVPQQLGEYSILREVGRGGMGVVYEAVQNPLGRHVALKMLPAFSLIDPLRLKRFQHEAQAAARLHHTNIVPVFGVGVDAGVHYYAMQYIQGRGLDEVLDELQRLRESGDKRQAVADSRAACGESAIRTAVNLSTLSDSPRYFYSVARLVMQVAEALEYAHRQGVVHRDIKPANLLLDAEGTIWITDFGLAHCAGQEDLTKTGDLVGTLRYAAPERLHGDGDARADVYSLGLTLYELLTLQPAFSNADRVTLVRQIAQDDPPRPRRLDGRIPRDMETIVLKAISKDPRGRYATAGAMAGDLRRFLGDQPIEARRALAWERAWRWCRRNPAVATASMVAAVTLVVGLAVSLWQWKRADANFKNAQASAAAATASAALAESHAVQADHDYERALDAIDQMLTRVGVEELYSVPHMDKTRRALLEDALRFYEQLLANPRSGLQARAAVARAHFRLGMINSHLGDRDRSQQHFDKALALVEDLLLANGKNAEYRSLLANVRYWRGLANLQTQRESEMDYREALRIWKDLSTEFPERTEFVRAQAHALHSIGILLQQNSSLHEAEGLLRQSIELAEGLLTIESEKAQATDLLARALQNLAVLCETDQRLAEAEQHARRALEIRESGTAVGLPPDDRRNLAQALATLALIQAKRGSRPDDRTEQFFNRALQIDRGLTEDHPDAPLYWHQLAAAAHGYGLWLSNSGRRSEAEKSFREAIEAWETALKIQPQTDKYLFALGGAFSNLALEHKDRGDLAGARRLIQQAINHQEAALTANPRITSAYEFLGKHYWLQRRILRDLGDEPALDKAIADQLATLAQLQERNGRFQPLQVLRARVHSDVGHRWSDARRLSEAEQMLRTAIANWQELTMEGDTIPSYFGELGAALNNLAIVMAHEHRWDEMVPLLEEAIRHQTAAVQAAPKQPLFKRFLHNHYNLLAQAHYALGRHLSVSELAAKVLEQCPDAGHEYVWAVRMAACIGLVGNDPGLPPDESQTLTAQYGDQAVAFLQSAQRNKSQQVRNVAAQPEFKALRQRPDFQSLVSAAENAAK